MAKQQQMFEEGWGDVSEDMRRPSGWLKVPARGSLSIVFLSDAPVKYRLHWMGRKPVVCPTDGCTLCEIGVGGETRWCFSVYDLQHKAHGFFEVNINCAKPLSFRAAELGRLRGLVFVFRKEGGTATGRILLDEGRLTVLGEDLPKEQDVKSALVRQWAAQGLRMPDGSPAFMT
jgi:hypothetical protein